MSIPILKALSNNTGEAELALEAIGQRLDIDPRDYKRFQWIGHGAYAEVYWIPDRKRVLKITRDNEDANVSRLVQKKPDKAFVKVYDVFEVFSYRWGIVAEKLTPMSNSLEMSFGRCLALCTFLDIEVVPISDILEFFHDPKVLDQPEVIDEMKAVRVSREEVESFLKTLRKWERALDARNIFWKDVKPSNVMMRGRELVISDLGYSEAPHQKIPELQVSGV